MTAAADMLTLTADSGATATLAPGRGFNLFRLALPNPAGDPVEVLAAEPEFPAGGKPSHSGLPLLFPFPNRIKAGEFVTDQQSEHLLPLGDGPDEVHDDGAGNAIHGFVFDRPWRVTDRSDAAATGEFRLSRDAPDRAELWPGDATLTVRYELSGSCLRCDLRVESVGEEPLPFGLGTHPYFRLPVGPGGTADDCTVTVPAAARWELIAGVPTGEVVDAEGSYDLRHGPRFGDLELDDVYTRVAPTADDPGVIESVIENPATGLKLVQRCDPAFREQVVFTPPWFRANPSAANGSGAICVEPYTCATDAANLSARGTDAGWRTLDPGGTFETWFEISVR